MNYVIDIQGFWSEDGQFLPKEVAVVSYEDNAMAHWIITPPYPITELCSSRRAQNNWLSSNHHGLEWFEGDVSCEQLTAHLRSITRWAKNIFCRGAQKAKFLREVTSREIINLERAECECPAFKDMSSDVTCILHASERKGLHCALHNATKLRDWLRSRGLPGKTISSIPFRTALLGSLEQSQTNEIRITIDPLERGEDECGPWGIQDSSSSSSYRSSFCQTL